MRGLLDQLEELNVFEVRINGGEPLLHPDIDEILMTLKGKRFRKVILTNGTLLNEKKVRLLEESGVVPTVGEIGVTKPLKLSICDVLLCHFRSILGQGKLPLKSSFSDVRASS